MEEQHPIGYIVGGSLREGLFVRLSISPEEVQEGSFVVCDSGNWRFYGLITNLALGATNPRFADERPSRIESPFIRQALMGKTLYTTIEMFPTLMMDRGPDPNNEPSAYLDWQEEFEKGKIGPQPVKTVPAHHVSVRLADRADVDTIFKAPAESAFVIGHTLEQKHPINLDLRKLVKRSMGIFGATGTGKSFLTRMVLAGVMSLKDQGDEKSPATIVFDMHNEYAFDVPDPDGTGQTRGLSYLFGSKLQTVALGKETIRGERPDFDLLLSTKDITSEDVLLLSGMLNLTDTAASTLGALVSDFKNDWFAKFMKMIPGKMEEIEDSSGKLKKVPSPDSVEFWANDSNVHPKAASALHNKLMRIYRQDYVVEQLPNDPISMIINSLENGRHIVLSFGKHDDELDYLLVSNILTRRIRERWVQLTEASHIDKIGRKPRPLIIAIEEAHKLLSPQLSKQTAFGIIARELRKYFVTLLVVDQRPSGIDDEVMSQLGTRITGWLGDEDDIRAVLTGLAGRDQLRGMLARLQEKEEVLLLGWGVKMPIPVRSRRYDETFYADVKAKTASAQSSLADLDDDEFNDALFG